LTLENNRFRNASRIAYHLPQADNKERPRA
jgi:hypothetical protein